MEESSSSSKDHGIALQKFTNSDMIEHLTLRSLYYIAWNLFKELISVLKRRVYPNFMH